MSLPKVDVPTYELKIPSSGKEITVRPFLVKEEKLLLMAAASDDPEEVVRTTKQVINNCIIDEDVKIDTLPFFDIDYLFIALRAKSIGESIEMQFTCNAVTSEDVKCGHIFEADIDVSNVSVVVDPDIQKVIQLDNLTTIKMKYPTYAVMKDISDERDLIDNKIYVMVNCIDQIIKGEQVFSSKDYTKEELKEFIESLTEQNFKKLEEFVDNFPYFYVGVSRVCPKCKFEHNLKYTDFQSFFL